MSILFLDSINSSYLDEKEENKKKEKHEQFLHVIMIQKFEYIFCNLCQMFRLQNIAMFSTTVSGQNISLCGRGFHTPVERKIGYKVINKWAKIALIPSPDY